MSVVTVALAADVFVRSFWSIIISCSATIAIARYILYYFVHFIDTTGDNYFCIESLYRHRHPPPLPTERPAFCFRQPNDRTHCTI